MSTVSTLQPYMVIMFTDRVRIIRAKVVKSGMYGKKRDWGNATTVFEGLACVQPDRAFEARSPERETAQERLLVYLPHGTDVNAQDRIMYRDMVFEVDGDPQEWRKLTLRHVRVKAWRVEH